MGKTAISKELMGMRKEQMPMKKSKGGFPPVPKEHKAMDDLGYWTKVKKAKGK
jgi:hypothetical protein